MARRSRKPAPAPPGCPHPARRLFCWTWYQCGVEGLSVGCCECGDILFDGPLAVGPEGQRRKQTIPPLLQLAWERDGLCGSAKGRP